MFVKLMNLVFLVLFMGLSSQVRGEEEVEIGRSSVGLRNPHELVITTTRSAQITVLDPDNSSVYYGQSSDNATRVRVVFYLTGTFLIKAEASDGSSTEYLLWIVNEDMAGTEDEFQFRFVEILDPNGLSSVLTQSIPAGGSGTLLALNAWVAVLPKPRRKTR